MRLPRALALAALASSLAACGGHSASPESVARAWSKAINAGDNEAAGDLFARDARVVQQSRVIRLHTHADAVAWNAALPCSGRIVALTARSDRATVTFRLGDRPASRCDGPGATVRALFLVHDGKIVLWHQLAGTAAPGQPIQTLDGEAAERLPSPRSLETVSAERGEGRSALRALGDV